MITTIPVRSLSPSPTNPRRIFDPVQMAELAESIKAHGILQPILARPIPVSRMTVVKGVATRGQKNIWSVKRGGQVIDGVLIRTGLVKADAEAIADQFDSVTHEIVAGERRWRAARDAGLTEVPAIVSELTDQEALEIQVIENLQRSDLQPLEEAEGYEALMKRNNYTAEEIAAKVGKSKAYVYGRLKLMALCPEGRKMLAEGKINAAVALLVARIPNQELQAEALENVCLDYDDEPNPVRQVAAEIQRAYMLRLKEAPFSTKDAGLVESAGACTNCPHRTGNQKDLFADVESADVCTNPKCYQSKVLAYSQKRVEQAKAKGQKVVEDAFDANGYASRAYVKATDKPWTAESGSKTWKQALGKAPVEVVLALDKHGVVHELLPRKEAEAALKQVEKSHTNGDDEADMPRYDRKAELRKQKVEDLTNWKITEQVLAAYIDGEQYSMDVRRAICRGAYHATNVTQHAECANRRGLSKNQIGAREALKTWIEDKARTMEELDGMTFELLCLAYPFDEEEWVELVRASGVDSTKCQQAAEAEIK